MADIRLGPAGRPAGSTLEGVEGIRKLGLQAMEVQFSHGVGMGLDLARRIGEAREREGIELSVHAPYYVNLASDDGGKRKASEKRILDSCERAHLMGANKVVFHPAYFGSHEKGAVYRMARDSISGMLKTIKDEGWDVRLAPETTGKHSALGSLEEILALSSETGCSFCVDFAHLYARNYGKIDYGKVLAAIMDSMKDSGRRERVHCHFSGIEYTAKGERKHTPMDGNPPFRPLAQGMLESGMDFTVISESPLTWKDSQKMRDLLEGLGYSF